MQSTLPSERNLEIYHRVEFGGESLRAVAAETQLSPTRVNEICRQVERWYQQSQPQWAGSLDRRAQALATWRIHGERLRFLYGQAMDSWRASHGEHTISRREGYEAPNTVTTTRQGETRYLLSAMRVSREMALAATAVARLPAECFGESVVTSLPEVQPAIAAAPVEAPCEPPISAGALEAAAAPTSTADAAAAEAATAETPDAYDDAFEREAFARALALPILDPVRRLSKRKRERREKRAMLYGQNGGAMAEGGARLANVG